jgi:polyphosphate glucokinase
VKVLSVDLGGTNVKCLASGETKRRKRPSGPDFTPQELVDSVRKMSGDWEYQAISIGFPGPVSDDGPGREPHNLGPGWLGFDFELAFGMPVKMLNDAAMQALGSYEGGRMLFIGLGTGMGSALVLRGRVEPTELAHLPYKKGRTYEDYLGKRGLERLGKKKWRKAVADVVERLAVALQVDYAVIGGGNAKLLKKLPDNVRLGSNANAFIGGFRLWERGGA